VIPHIAIEDGFYCSLGSGHSSEVLMEMNEFISSLIFCPGNGCKEPIVGDFPVLICVSVIIFQVHPSKKYFAVAEKGQAPNINIFEYPSLKLFRIMRGGTEKSYAYVDFRLVFIITG